MKHAPKSFALLLLILLSGSAANAESIQWPTSNAVLQQTTGQIRTQLNNGDPQSIDGVRMRLPSQLTLYYQQRNFEPLWVDKDGILIEAAELFQALKGSNEEGLPVRDYPVSAIERYLYGKIDSPAQLASLDLLLTDSFLLYSRNVRSGRLTPHRASGEWFLPYTRYDGSQQLTEALQNHTMSEVLAGLPPANEGYRQLRHALHYYLAIAARGGWPQLAKGEVLHLASSGPRVVQLRKRLQITGDLPAEKGTLSEQFDAPLQEAVLSFQQRHGLRGDGTIGAKTLAALNMPVEERLRQIEANMERWRWLPKGFPERYIVVNMAGYKLQVIQDDEPVMTMRVIVGRDYRQTPVFASQVTLLVLNPAWYVPPTIIRDDIMPLLRRDPARLKRRHLRLFSNGNEIDATSIDWSKVDGEHFPYTLRQDPGPDNPLGRIKFLLPNSDGIYLHDTPDHHLFDKVGRALSSGCIRLEHPIELALYLLADPESWNRTTLEEKIDRGVPVGLVLPKPVPIYFNYWTVWVDGEGVIQFRGDVYHRDRRLLRIWGKTET